MKKILITLILSLNFLTTSSISKNNIYKKIDLFGEVLENIKKDT